MWPLLALLAGALLAPAVACAQVWEAGQGEAEITVAGRTLFLSADNAAGPHPMIDCGAGRLDFGFARLHLRFPLPPRLDVALTRAAGDPQPGWRLDHARLAFGRGEPDLVLDPATTRIEEIGAGVDDVLRLRLTGSTLRVADLPGARIEPVEIVLEVICPTR